MKSVMMIIGVIIIIMLSGAMLDSTNEFRGGSQTDYFNVTTTNDTTTTCTLSEDILDDEKANITSISSNHTHDAPISTDYNSSTEVLTVGGLATSTQRQLTIVYEYPRLESYWGANMGARSWPMFIVLGVIGCIAGAVYMATRGGI